MDTSWSVITVHGCFPPMHSKNVANSQTNVSIVSSSIIAQANKQFNPCPVIPTKGAKGKLYLFVLYVVSKLRQSPYNSYCFREYPSDQKMHWTLFASFL